MLVKSFCASRFAAKIVTRLLVFPQNKIFEAPLIASSFELAAEVDAPGKLHFHQLRQELSEISGSAALCGKYKIAIFKLPDLQGIKR